MRASSDSIVQVAFNAEAARIYVIDCEVTPGTEVAFQAFAANDIQTNEARYRADDGHARFVPTPAPASEFRRVQLSPAVGQGWTLTRCTVLRAD